MWADPQPGPHLSQHPEAPLSKGFKEEGRPGCPMKPGQQEGRQVEVPIRIHFPASQARRLCPQTHSSPWLLCSVGARPAEAHTPILHTQHTNTTG